MFEISVNGSSADFWGRESGYGECCFGMKLGLRLIAWSYCLFGGNRLALDLTNSEMNSE